MAHDLGHGTPLDPSPLSMLEEMSSSLPEEQNCGQMDKRTRDIKGLGESGRGVQ